MEAVVGLATVGPITMGCTTVATVGSAPTWGEARGEAVARGVEGMAAAAAFSWSAPGKFL
jgi:hypothetical protein